MAPGKIFYARKTHAYISGYRTVRPVAGERFLRRFEETEMNKRVIEVLSCVFVLLFSLGAAQANVRSESDELVQETKVSYVATHNDGSTERVIVAYQGYVYHRIWQSGSSSKWDHPVDNRQCHIETKAKVIRRAFLVSHSGVNAPIEGYQHIYNLADYTDRGPGNAFEALTRHVTCGDVAGNFQQRIESVKTLLTNTFDEIVATDEDSNRTRLTAMLKAKELSKSP